MVEYESIKCEYIDYGVNKFIEVSRKKAMPDEAEFINISKGYYNHENEKRYQGGLGFPTDKEFITKLSDALLNI